MALNLKLDIRTSEDCKNLVIEDITGAYSSQNNPGGWGGFNIDGNRQNFTIIISVNAYVVIEETQYVIPFNLPNFANLVDYPSEDSYRGFKVSVPAYDISSQISISDFIPDSYNPMQEVLQDGLYEVSLNIVSADALYNQEFIFEFRSICNSQKAVDKMMGTINLNCEDCDDSDIENALLAKSLLESIKNM